MASAMLDHVSLGVTDLERSKAFYDAVLKPLGVSRFYDYEGGLGYGTAADKIQFWIVRCRPPRARRRRHPCRLQRGQPQSRR